MRALAPIALLLAVGCAEDAPSDAVPAGASQEAAPFSEDAFVVDFGADGENRWYAVNDTVMGGESDGSVVYSDETLGFEGFVSTDSNGGFTSVRSPEDGLGLAAYDTVVIRMKSEGQPFTMVVATSPYWFQESFRYDIEVPQGEWQIVEIPFRDFELHEFQGGYPTPTGETMRRKDRKDVFHIELMSKLFEEGPFDLEVDWIAFD